MNSNIKIENLILLCLYIQENYIYAKQTELHM